MTEEEKSKSQKKRDAEALQNLGYQLTKLNGAQLDTIPLAEKLKEALLFAKTIKSNAAKKRHMQFIGRLMRDVEDIEAIERAHDKILQGHAADRAQFHLTEQWRDRLLSKDENALTDFLSQYPCDAIQQLRQLVRKAKHEQEKQKNLGSAKALFQLIKSIIE